MNEKSNEKAKEKTKEKKQERNLEEVETTLDEIRREEKRKKSSVPLWKSILFWVFIPFTMAYKGVKHLFKKIRIPITVKTSVTYTLLFTVAVALLGEFIVSSVENHLESIGAADAKYISNLRLTSAALILISIAVVAALGSLVSQAVLSPLRKMIKRIDDIGSDDDLTRRLDIVDSQDELRELTERINAMLDKLEQSFERQRKFVSDASHELKTPISVIQGYSNLLLRWGKDDRAVLDESVESIAREAQNMKRIVEQLLTLAKLGKYMYTPVELDLGRVLSATLDGYTLINPNRKFTLKCATPIKATLDENMFTECVRALVDNAVKYSNADSAIVVTCTEKEEYAVVSVKDNGWGISESDLPHVFDRFYRCDRARTREKNSSGLGLTIAKSLVEFMNGTIEVKSKLGVGSTFTMRFPLKEETDE